MLLRLRTRGEHGLTAAVLGGEDGPWSPLSRNTVCLDERRQGHTSPTVPRLGQDWVLTGTETGRGWVWGKDAKASPRLQWPHRLGSSSTVPPPTVFCFRSALCGALQIKQRKPVGWVKTITSYPSSAAKSESCWVSVVWDRLWSSFCPDDGTSVKKKVFLRGDV